MFGFSIVKPPFSFTDVKAIANCWDWRPVGRGPAFSKPRLVAVARGRKLDTYLIIILHFITNRITKRKFENHRA